MTATRPAVYRISRGIRMAGVVVTVLIVVFVVTAGYSASRFRAGPGEAGASQLVGQNTIELTSNINVTNGGVFSLTHLSIEGDARYDGPNGTLLVRGSSPLEDVPGGGHAAIPFALRVTFGTAAAADLLTQDARLPSTVWVNATYAAVFLFRLTLPENVTWGAPFYGLQVASGTPTAQANGTVAFPITITFANHASFGVDGELSFVLRSAAGASCGAGATAIDAPPGSSFRGGVTVYATTSCDPRGGTVDSAFTGPTFSLSLPTEAIP